MLGNFGQRGCPANGLIGCKNRAIFDIGIMWSRGEIAQIGDLMAKPGQGLSQAAVR
jgi:hypothetical protein